MIDALRRVEHFQTHKVALLVIVEDEARCILVSAQSSIRANERYRVCFAWTESGPAALEIMEQK